MNWIYPVSHGVGRTFSPPIHASADAPAPCRRQRYPKSDSLLNPESACLRSPTSACLSVRAAAPFSDHRSNSRAAYSPRIAAPPQAIPTSAPLSPLQVRPIAFDTPVAQQTETIRGSHIPALYPPTGPHYMQGFVSIPLEKFTLSRHPRSNDARAVPSTPSTSSSRSRFVQHFYPFKSFPPGL